MMIIFVIKVWRFSCTCFSRSWRRWWGHFHEWGSVLWTNNFPNGTGSPWCEQCCIFYDKKRKLLKDHDQLLCEQIKLPQSLIFSITGWSNLKKGTQVLDYQTHDMVIKSASENRNFLKSFTENYPSSEHDFHLSNHRKRSEETR